MRVSRSRPASRLFRESTDLQLQKKKEWEEEEEEEEEEENGNPRSVWRNVTSRANSSLRRRTFSRRKIYVTKYVPFKAQTATALTRNS